MPGTWGQDGETGDQIRRVNHLQRVLALYPRWRDALDAVDQHEREVIAEHGGNQALAIRALSAPYGVGADWVYKRLSGSKDGLERQLLVEIGMAMLVRQLGRQES